MGARANGDPQCQDRAQKANSVEIFQNSLHVYRKLVACDYHDHALIARLLHNYIIQHCTVSRSLRLLDLGCGDGSFVPTVLLQGNSIIPLSKYVGVDLSANSLQMAAQQQLPGSCRQALVQQDMLSFLQGQPPEQGQQEGRGRPDKDSHGKQGEEPAAGRLGAEVYDVILGALALHHIPTAAGKLALLAAARARLEPGGCMLVMDIFCKEGESREEFMERAHKLYFQTFDQFTVEEAELIWSHVSEHDFPETEQEYRQLAAAAGFGKVQCLHECRFSFIKVLALCA